MSWSLPSSLVNQVYLFYPSSSIHPPGIVVTQSSHAEITCSKQSLRLQPCQYHWSCGICRCWDWRGTGMKTWHWKVAPMKGQTVLKLAADYGCVHTHTAYFHALQILWWNSNCLCNSSFIKERGQALHDCNLRFPHGSITWLIVDVHNA